MKINKLEIFSNINNLSKLYPQTKKTENKIQYYVIIFFQCTSYFNFKGEDYVI